MNYFPWPKRNSFQSVGTQSSVSDCLVVKLLQNDIESEEGFFFLPILWVTLVHKQEKEMQWLKEFQMNAQQEYSLNI